MHILFLTDNFPPEGNAPATRTFEHTREWVKQGHKVTVITCAPNFPEGKMFDGYQNKWLSKERIEVFEDGRVLQLDNFVKLKGYGFKGFKKMNLWKQDKGQNECSRLFLESIKNGTPSPIPIDEIFEVAKVSIDVAEQIRNQ